MIRLTVLITATIIKYSLKKYTTNLIDGTYQERPRERPYDVQQPLAKSKEGANSYRIAFILKDKLKPTFFQCFFREFMKEVFLCSL